MKNITYTNRTGGSTVGTTTLSFDGRTTEALNLDGASCAGIAVPEGLSGEALTVEVTTNGENWFPLYADDGETVELAIAAGTAVTLRGAQFLGWKGVRFVSDADEGESANIQVVTKGV